MQSISMTRARRDLAHISQSPDTYQLTSRGQEVATLRVFAKVSFDPAKAKAAGQRMLAASRSVKPSRAKGATALVRELRDA